MKKIMSVFLSLVLFLSVISFSFFCVRADAVSYSGSSSYMSGRYYTALCNVNLTGNQVNDIVAIAESQLGYKSGSSNSDLSGETTSTGNVKYSEYGYMIGSNPNDWCAYFVSWCARRANISTDIFPSFAGCSPAYRDTLPNAGCVMHSGSSGYVPVKGDLIFFGDSSTNVYHVGIVKQDSDGVTVKYIDGNNIDTTPHCVHDSQKRLTNSEIWGYATPKYETTTPTSPTAPTVSVDKTIAAVGEQITITWTSCENATYYWLSCWSSSEHVLNQEVTGNSFTFSLPYADTYGITVVAGNAIGSTEGNWPHIKVYNSAPSAPVVSVNKTTAAVGEQITITWTNCENATYYWLSCWSSTEHVLNQEVYGNSYSFTLPYVDTYGITVVAGNQKGETEGNWSHIKVYNSLPSAPVVTVDKTLAAVGETITLTWDRVDDAIYSWLYIYHNDTLYFEGGFNPNDSYTRNLTASGHYTYRVVAHNSIGDTSSSLGEFYVYDSPPSVPVVTVDKTLAAIGETVTLTWDNVDDAVCSWLYIYHNDTLYFEGGFDPNDSYTRNLTAAGHYTYKVVAHNSIGDTSSSFGDFYVYDTPPSAPCVSADKTTAEIGSIITVSWNGCNDAIRSLLYIYLDDVLFFEGGFDPNDSYSRNYSVPGHYTFYVVEYNSLGETSSSIGEFSVFQNHNYENGTIIKAATCTEEGLVNYVCAVCGGTKEELLEKTPHRDDNRDGTCDNCGAVIDAAAEEPNCVCGQRHTGPLSKLIIFFHKLLDVFRHLFNFAS